MITVYPSKYQVLTMVVRAAGDEEAQLFPPNSAQSSGGWRIFAPLLKIKVFIRVCVCSCLVGSAGFLFFCRAAVAAELARNWEQDLGF